MPGEREYHGGTIGQERPLDDSECPLAIAMQHPPSRGTVAKTVSFVFSKVSFWIF